MIIKKNRKVMMIGTKIDGKGGISSVIRDYRDFGILEKLNIEYFESHSGGTKIHKLLFYIFQMIKIVKNINRFSIVHLHTASYWSFKRKCLLVLISKVFKKKVVIHLHGAKFVDYYNKSMPIEKILIKKVFGLSDRIVCLSPQWYQDLSDFCPKEKISIIPNCVPIQIHINSDKSNEKKIEKTILLFGRLGERKGVYDLLSAIGMLRLGDYNAKLILCGDGEINKIEKKVEELGLNDAVHLAGWVDGEKKIDLLRNGYFYVLPSYFEGLPVSILEAMSYGLPIVSTNVGGIPYVIDDGVEGFLVEPGNISLLRDRIRTLLLDETLQLKMSRAALLKVQKKFSMENLVSMLHQLYDETIN